MSRTFEFVFMNLYTVVLFKYKIIIHYYVSFIIISMEKLIDRDVDLYCSAGMKLNIFSQEVLNFPPRGRTYIEFQVYRKVAK